MLRKTGVRPKGAERVLADTEFGVQFFENANERLGWSFERALGQLTHLLYSRNVVRHQHIALPLPLTANHLSGIFDPTKAKYKQFEAKDNRVRSEMEANRKCIRSEVGGKG